MNANSCCTILTVSFALQFTRSVRLSFTLKYNAKSKIHVPANSPMCVKILLTRESVSKRQPRPSLFGDRRHRELKVNESTVEFLEINTCK